MSTQGTSDTSDGDLTPTAQLRRGDRAIGTDGDLGAVEQLVVDQDTGEQRGIVVRRASDNAEFEIPVDRVQRLGDGEVYLNVARADLGTRPDVARPYDPGQYVPVYPGDTASRDEAERLAQDTGHPVVTNVEQNAAEVVAPEAVVAGTDTTVDAPTTPRTQAARTDTAAPVVGSGQTERTRPLGDQARAGGARPPERVPLTNDVRNRAPQPGPIAEPSPTESSTGDLIGGRPTTGGMGANASVTSEPVPPQDRPGTERSAATFNAPAQRADMAAAGARRGLADMTDDELANPDAVLSTGGPREGETVTRPFDVTITAGEPATTGAAAGSGATPASASGMAQDFAIGNDVPPLDVTSDTSPGEFDATAGVMSGLPRVQATAIPADTHPTETWQPDETDAGMPGTVGVARPTPYTPVPEQQPASARQWAAPAQPAVQAVEQGEGGTPQWLVPVAAGVGGLLLAGGAIAGTIMAIQQRRNSTQYKARQAATATKQGLAATAAATLAKAQGLREQVVKPAARQASAQAGDTSQQVKAAARQTREAAKQSAKQAAQQVKQAAQQVRESAQEARASAKDAQRQVQKSAKRTVRRARWFRRGLLAGAAVALLYAPMPGEELRAQLADRLQQLQSRMAS